MTLIIGTPKNVPLIWGNPHAKLPSVAALVAVAGAGAAIPRVTYEEAHLASTHPPRQFLSTWLIGRTLSHAHAPLALQDICRARTDPSVSSIKKYTRASNQESGTVAKQWTVRGARGPSRPT